MSVPPVSSSSQVPVGQSASMPAPEALTSDTAASAFIAPLLFFLHVTLSGNRADYTASEALLVLQEGPRTSQSSLLAETIPETQDISLTQDFSRDDEVMTLDHTVAW